jgi:hypothetical protein
MKCPECNFPMTRFNSEHDYNPPGDWEYFYYWQCNMCFETIEEDDMEEE